MKLNFSKNDKYANLIPRLLATLIDSSFNSIFLMVVLYFITVSITLENLFTSILYFLSFGIFPTIIISAIYTITTTSKYGKTLGKALLGLEVTDKSGKYLSLSMAIFREFFAKIVNGATFGFSYFVILFDKDHMGWHDQIAGTHVHQKIKNRVWIGLLTLLILYTIVFGLSFATVPNLYPLIESFKQ